MDALLTCPPFRGKVRVALITMSCHKGDTREFLNALVRTEGQYALLVIVAAFAPLFGWIAGGLAFGAPIPLDRVLVRGTGSSFLGDAR